MASSNNENGHAVGQNGHDHVYSVGDLLWCKMQGHPFWPCMITFDPVEDRFSKDITYKGKHQTIYHIQYFGKTTERGWTQSCTIFAYEGLSEYGNTVKELKNKAYTITEKKKVEAKYLIPPSRKTKWHAAVEEAETALPMTNTERLETYMIQYHKIDSKKRPRKDSESDSEDDSISDSSEKSTNSVVKQIKKDPPPSHSDTVCHVCEQTGSDVLTCTGECKQSYHLSCLHMTATPLSFKCPECESGIHSCFICKSSSDILKKCSVANCGKFYHMDCLRSFDTAKVADNVCPYHTCLTCYNENPRNPLCYKSRFLKCIRCPIAYHNRDNCIAAGSKMLTSNIILCPEHFTQKKGRQFQTTCNITWCFVCGVGGVLVCCETCPAAFHPKCLDIELTQDKFFCPDCASRKQLCYGMIVWVKIGVFRWWAAEIKNPRDVPQNIQNFIHFVGEFPIQYFGTGEYFWTHKGRCFLYDEDDQHTPKERNKRSSSLELKYGRSLREAAIAFNEWKEMKFLEKLGNEKPPPYKHIRVNKPIGNVQISTIDLKNIVQCSCDPTSENPCGYNSECLNRISLYECHPAVCKAKALCQNQCFTKRQYASVLPVRNNNCGWGLKACQDIKKGQFIIEYVGDVINEEECTKRTREKHEANDLNLYFLTLDKDRIIDAGPRGNLSRFMNHSCEPNCETQKWIVNGDIRIGLFAITDITSGAELTFDYQMDSLDYEKLKCYCGSLKCTGAIGAKQLNGIKPTKTVTKKKKKKRRLNVREDDICYRCDESGTLVMCDRKGCTKAYHLQCLGRDSTPVGRWICPWHCCDVCGKSSKHLCSRCPNSFCEKHRTPETITVLDSGLLLCNEHQYNDDSEVITDETQ